MKDRAIVTIKLTQNQSLELLIVLECGVWQPVVSSPSREPCVPNHYFIESFLRILNPLNR